MKNLQCLFANIEKINNTDFLNEEEYLKNISLVEKDVIECIFNKNSFIKTYFKVKDGVFISDDFTMLIAVNFIEISIKTDTGIKYKSVDALSYSQIENFVETFDETKLNLIKENVENLKFLLN